MSLIDKEIELNHHVVNKRPVMHYIIGGIIGLLLIVIVMLGIETQRAKNQESEMLVSIDSYMNANKTLETNIKNLKETVAFYEDQKDEENVTTYTYEVHQLEETMKSNEKNIDVINETVIRNNGLSRDIINEAFEVHLLKVDHPSLGDTGASFISGQMSGIMEYCALFEMDTTSNRVQYVAETYQIKINAGKIEFERLKQAEIPESWVIHDRINDQGLVYKSTYMIYDSNDYEIDLLNQYTMGAYVLDPFEENSNRIFFDNKGMTLYNGELDEVVEDSLEYISFIDVWNENYTRCLYTNELIMDINTNETFELEQSYQKVHMAKTVGDNIGMVFEDEDRTLIYCQYDWDGQLIREEVLENVEEIHQDLFVNLEVLNEDTAIIGIYTNSHESTDKFYLIKTDVHENISQGEASGYYIVYGSEEDALVVYNYSSSTLEEVMDWALIDSSGELIVDLSGVLISSQIKGIDIGNDLIYYEKGFTSTETDDIGYSSNYRYQIYNYETQESEVVNVPMPISMKEYTYYVSKIVGEKIYLTYNQYESE